MKKIMILVVAMGAVAALAQTWTGGGADNN